MNPKNKSRKFSILVAILILLVGVFIGGYLVLKSGRGAAQLLNADQLTAILNGKSFSAGTCSPDPNDASKDSDNDGLKDWQEIQIYQTDACKPDTDGDGYLDGEEAVSGYDPTKKAPGDEMPGTTHKTPRPLPQNLTEALRQNLAGQLKQNKLSAFSGEGGLLSSDQLAAYPAVQSSVQDILNNVGELFAADKIDDSQIKTANDNSRPAIQNYAVAVAACFSQTGPHSQSETEMFSNAIENSDFSELELNLQNYQDAYERLKEITVPSEMVSLHKEQLEIISKLIKIYAAIKDIEADPLKADLALQSYSTVRTETSDWMKKLSEFIKAHP